MVYLHRLIRDVPKPVIAAVNGVTEDSLDPDTRGRLDRDGYAPLPGVLSAGQLAVIRARLAELLAARFILDV